MELDSGRQGAPESVVAADASIIRAAAALKRSSTSLRAQARKLGTHFSHMKDYRKKFSQPDGVH